ncbi:MAG: hypothetical protein F7B17_05450 [Desulfurococcales archaeon]|nr:hypothetical protein [Desulfurococcales archaeon]
MGRLIVVRLDGASSGIYPRHHPIIESRIIDAVKRLAGSALLTAKSLGAEGSGLKVTLEAEGLKLVLSCEGLRCIGLGLAGVNEEGSFRGSIMSDPEGLRGPRIDL